MKPKIWKRGDHWYCCDVTGMLAEQSEHSIGEGLTQWSAYVDWLYS